MKVFMKKALIFFLIILLALCSLSACANDKYTVMTVGENAIGFDEYRYFYLNYRRDFTEEGITDSDELAKEIKENLVFSLRKKYAISEWAKEKGISLSSDELAYLKEQKQGYVDSYGGRDVFLAEIANGFMTEELFDSISQAQLIEDKLRSFEYNEFTGSIRSDDATVEKYIKDNFIHATHVLIMNDEGEDAEANYNLALSIAEMAANGTDFDSLILEYNEDTDMNKTTVGYYFAEGQLIVEFEQAALALEIGEVSGVVKSDIGYHVIKRLEIEDEYINKNFDTLRDIYKARMFNVMLEERINTLEIAYTDYHSTLTEQMIIDNIKKIKE
jgi:parvulin-like peptidyl-prolyl isomerase